MRVRYLVSAGRARGSPLPYGGMSAGVGRQMARLLQASEWRLVAALITHPTVCSDFRLTSHVSHSRTERALQLASQHAVAADKSRYRKSCPGPLYQRERAYAGVEIHESRPHRCRLHNSYSYLCAPGASACDISRTDSTHVDARLFCELCQTRDCRGGSVWVGSALKKYRIAGNPSPYTSNAVEAYSYTGVQGQRCPVKADTVCAQLPAPPGTPLK